MQLGSGQQGVEPKRSVVRVSKLLHHTTCPGVRDLGSRLASWYFSEISIIASHLVILARKLRVVLGPFSPSLSLTLHSPHHTGFKSYLLSVPI